MRTNDSLAFGLEALEGRTHFSASTLGASAAVSSRLPTITLPASGSLRAIGLTIHAFTTRHFSGDVGLLRNVPYVASDFRNLHAWIDWGDGSDASQATFTVDARGTIHVNGLHT